MTFGSLFSGIGGLDLGFERAGLTCSWQVEIDEFCRKVLAKHWPHVRRHNDVTTFPPEGSDLDDWRVDCIAGGFPCQDLSTAGRRTGIEKGQRSGLWSEFARIVCVLRPRFVVVENVPGLLAPHKDKGKVIEAAGIGRVLGDLAALGFDAEWHCVSAQSVGAAHIRDRVFVIAYPAGYRGGQRCISAGPVRERQGAADAERVSDGVDPDALCVGGRSRRTRRTTPLRQGRDTTGTADLFGPDPDRQSLAVRGSERGNTREELSPAERSGCEVREDAPDPDEFVRVERAEAIPTPIGDGASDESDRRGSPFCGSGWWSAEPQMGRVVYGLPRRMVRPAITGLGNAVVPQVAKFIGEQLIKFAS